MMYTNLYKTTVNHLYQQDIYTIPNHLYQPEKFQLPIEPNDVKIDPRLPWTPMELTCIGGK